jgi:hypothetical protein
MRHHVCSRTGAAMQTSLALECQKEKAEINSHPEHSKKKISSPQSPSPPESNGNLALRARTQELSLEWIIKKKDMEGLVACLVRAADEEAVEAVGEELP